MTLIQIAKVNIRYLWAKSSNLSCDSQITMKLYGQSETQPKYSYSMHHYPFIRTCIYVASCNLCKSLCHLATYYKKSPIPALMALPSTTLNSMLSCSNRGEAYTYRTTRKPTDWIRKRKNGAYAAPTHPSSSSRSTEGGTWSLEGWNGSSRCTWWQNAREKSRGNNTTSE